MLTGILCLNPQDAFLYLQQAAQGFAERICTGILCLNPQNAFLCLQQAAHGIREENLHRDFMLKSPLDAFLCLQQAAQGFVERICTGILWIRKPRLWMGMCELPEGGV